MKVCHKCLREVPFETRVLRSEYCPWCASALHCCLNCTFHDPHAHNECTEHGTDLIRDRDAANYCNFFQFAEGPRGGDNSEQQRAKKKLDGLFKI